ncbi:LAME_0F17304g1_1 [Lachancea meyersii CBS 8951]|uniref:LAME_0F17304g1_1 n=1 Tax=Lachancea meyersii CBS 8951 TaxID=1266667 RepID=A0A1G4JZU4_9SACH|nr:LAME_0F17304g1_1 [Lachancea meyersii CBS 8951]
MGKITTSSAIIHLASFCTSSWGEYRAVKVVLPAGLRDAGHRQFLTNIAVMATIVTNALTLLSYFRRENRFLVRVSRQFALPLALVLETVVALVYWPLRLFFLPLIMHNVRDGSRVPLPLSVDCAIHLLPVLYLAMDYLVLEPAPFQMSKKTAWLVVTLLGIGYNQYLTVLVDRDAGAVYPYPFLEVQEPYKTVIFGAVTSIAWIWFVIYKRLHTKLRRQQRPAKA